MQSTAILEDAFKQEFSGSKWRKYTVPEAVKILEDKAQATGSIHTSTQILLRKVKSCKTMQEFLQTCTTFLLGTCHE